jgi:transposase InsO family protein
VFIIITVLFRILLALILPSGMDVLFCYFATIEKEREILNRKKPERLSLKDSDRFFLSLIHRISGQAKNLVRIVEPETLLKWQRMLIRKFWTFGNKRKKPGRPPVPAEVKNLILKLKNENNGWGAGHIHGELLKLGIKLDLSTIKRILRTFRKGKKVKTGLTWRKFLSAQIQSIFAMDFFTVDTLFNARFYVFFIIRHQTREIVQCAITQFPSREFVRQQIMLFEEAVVQKAKDTLYLIHDGSGEFCFDLSDFGIRGVKTSPYAPNMNAIAERFIGSIRREALDWFLLFNEKQIFKIVSEFVCYYNSQRPHQGIGQAVPKGYAPQSQGQIRASPVLGGLYHHYFREAA